MSEGTTGGYERVERSGEGDCAVLRLYSRWERHGLIDPRRPEGTGWGAHLTARSMRAAPRGPCLPAAKRMPLHQRPSASHRGPGGSGPDSDAEGAGSAAPGGWPPPLTTRWKTWTAIRDPRIC